MTTDRSGQRPHDYAAVRADAAALAAEMRRYCPPEHDGWPSTRRPIELTVILRFARRLVDIESRLEAAG